MSLKCYTMSKYLYRVHDLFRIEKKNDYEHKNIPP